MNIKLDALVCKMVAGRLCAMLKRRRRLLEEARPGADCRSLDYQIAYMAEALRNIRRALLLMAGEREDDDE